jgi:hypothetical protein
MVEYMRESLRPAVQGWIETGVPVDGVVRAGSMSVGVAFEPLV